MKINYWCIVLFVYRLRMKVLHLAALAEITWFGGMLVSARFRFKHHETLDQDYV